jgi:hypothetical protein
VTNNSLEQAAILLHRLYHWWTDPQAGGPTTDFLDARVVYDRGYGGLSDQDLIWWVEQKPPWRDLQVIDEAVGAAKCALVFEGVDGATLLRHRVSWLVAVEGNRIVKIVETLARIE